MMSKMEPPQAFLKISVTDGASYVIPINVSFSVQSIVFLADGQYDHKSALQNNLIAELNFGSLVTYLNLILSRMDPEEV